MIQLVPPAGGDTSTIRAAFLSAQIKIQPVGWIRLEGKKDEVTIQKWWTQREHLTWRGLWDAGTEQESVQSGEPVISPPEFPPHRQSRLPTSYVTAERSRPWCWAGRRASACWSRLLRLISLWLLFPFSQFELQIQDQIPNGIMAKRISSAPHQELSCHFKQCRDLQDSTSNLKVEWISDWIDNFPSFRSSQVHIREESVSRSSLQDFSNAGVWTSALVEHHDLWVRAAGICWLTKGPTMPRVFALNSTPTVTRGFLLWSDSEQVKTQDPVHVLWAAV